LGRWIVTCWCCWSAWAAALPAPPTCMPSEATVWDSTSLAEQSNETQLPSPNFDVQQVTGPLLIPASTQDGTAIPVGASLRVYVLARLGEHSQCPSVAIRLAECKAPVNTSGGCFEEYILGSGTPASGPPQYPEFNSTNGEYRHVQPFRYLGKGTQFL
jgi:hypothetical protein